MSAWVAFAKSYQSGGDPSIKVLQKRKTRLIPQDVYVLDKLDNIVVTPKQFVAKIKIGAQLYEVYQIPKSEKKLVEKDVIMKIKRDGKKFTITETHVTIPTKPSVLVPTHGNHITIMTYNLDKTIDDNVFKGNYDFIALQNVNNMFKSLQKKMQYTSASSGTIRITTYYNAEKFGSAITVRGEFSVGNPFQLLAFSKPSILFVNVLVTSEVDFSKIMQKINSLGDSKKLFRKLLNKGKIIVVGSFNTNLPRTIAFIKQPVIAVSQSESTCCSPDYDKGRFDHIYFRNLREVESEVLETVNTTHLPVVATLEY